MVLYGTGMRRAEVARLKIGDIDNQRRIIRVVEGKGGKDRDPAVNAPLWHCPKCGGPMCVARRLTAAELSLLSYLDSS
jgi:hypothetical protein